MLAGSEPTILSKQGKTLLLRLKLALWCRQVPAVGCLSPGRNMDMAQPLHISCRGFLHHTAHHGAVVVLSGWVVPKGRLRLRTPGRAPWGQPTSSWTMCRCPHSPLHQAMALAYIHHPSLHARLQIGDCILIKRLFHKGLSILFAIIQSPSSPVHGCANSPSGKCISCLCRREILARLNANLAKPNGIRVFQRPLAEPH